MERITEDEKQELKELNKYYFGLDKEKQDRFYFLQNLYEKEFMTELQMHIFIYELNKKNLVLIKKSNGEFENPSNRDKYHSCIEYLKFVVIPSMFKGDLSDLKSYKFLIDYFDNFELLEWEC